LGGIKGESGINMGYVVKIGVYLLKICIGRGVQQKDFWRYFSMSSEIREIL
jgi:hypothetical protein